MAGWKKLVEAQTRINVVTYRTVEHMLALVSALLDMALESARVERLKQLKATEQLGRYRHDGAPVIKLTAVLSALAVDRDNPGGNDLHWGH